MRRAIELDPTSAEIYIRYGHYLSMLGRTEEAIAARRRAVSLDPLSEPANAGLADTLFLAGRYGEALRELARIEEVAPEYPILHLRARIALAQGHYESALAHIAGERLEWRRLYISAIAHYRLGDRAKARDELAALVERHGKAIALQAAIVHSQFGEFDAAFRWLETAVEQNDPGIVELMADPELEPLRSDARFPRLLREAGFPPPP